MCRSEGEIPQGEERMLITRDLSGYWSGLRRWGDRHQCGDAALSMLSPRRAAPIERIVTVTERIKEPKNLRVRSELY